MRWTAFIMMLSLLPAAALAQDGPGGRESPPSLEELQSLQREKTSSGEESDAMPVDIRRDAMQEAALSFGARGGLAWRTYQIRDELGRRADYLDKIYNFRQLLIPTQGGLLIEPPIISESLEALKIDSDGLSAAVSDSIYNIGRNARIVSAPRTWRAYLEREWGGINPPPDILRPENKQERADWLNWTSEGWQQGIDQADQIFQEDLNQLTADYRGMIRYRKLLAQGMVSPPYALQIERGVTGGGDEMRVGDRALSITGLPALKPDVSEWQPANR